MDRSEREAVAAATLRECRGLLATRGSTVLTEIAAGEEGVIADWRHYPPGEVYDPLSHAQYFYHQHPAAAAHAVGGGEVGHFHLFLRGEGMPPGCTPLLLPEQAVARAVSARQPPAQSAPLKRGSRDEVCHLVAVAVDAAGEPVRLLTTNRWVTGETWYEADDVIAMLARFRLSGEGRWGLVSRWLAALVSLFQADIAGLLQQRDRVVRERRWRWRSNVFEDLRLEVPSSLPINLDARLAAIAAAAAVPAPLAARPPSRLPPMAEGWGA